MLDKEKNNVKNTYVVMLSKLGKVAPTLQVVMKIRWENSCKTSSIMPGIGAQ